MGDATNLEVCGMCRGLIGVRYFFFPLLHLSPPMYLPMNLSLTLTDLGRRDRAESIAREKRKKGFPVKIPGIITLYVLPDGTFKLLDGQHRYGGRSFFCVGRSVLFSVDSYYLLYSF